MGLKEDICDLVAELDNYEINLSIDEPRIPSFVTSRNGYQVNFLARADRCLNKVSDTIFNIKEINASTVIEKGEFRKIVRQCIADFYAEGKLGLPDADDKAINIDDLLEEIKTQVSNRVYECTHYFPAWTLGMERVRPFQLGPVIFLTREQWIKSVDIPTRVKETFGNEKEANFLWKDILLNIFKNGKSEEVNLKGFSNHILPSHS